MSLYVPKAKHHSSARWPPAAPPPRKRLGAGLLRPHAGSLCLPAGTFSMFRCCRALLPVHLRGRVVAPTGSALQPINNMLMRRIRKLQAPSHTSLATGRQSAGIALAEIPSPRLEFRTLCSPCASSLVSFGPDEEAEFHGLRYPGPRFFIPMSYFCVLLARSDAADREWQRLPEPGCGWCVCACPRRPGISEKQEA